MEKKGWKTLEENEIYSNPAISLYENLVLDPNNNERLRNLMKVKNNSVVIIAKKGDSFYLVGQYRYGSDSYSLEFANGGIEKGEAPLTAGKRELEEELGFVSESWKDLGEFDPLNSLMRRKCYVFLADNVEAAINRQHFPDQYEKLDIKEINIEDFEKMVQNNEIGDSFTLVAYLKYKISHIL